MLKEQRMEKKKNSDNENQLPKNKGKVELKISYFPWLLRTEIVSTSEQRVF